MDSIKSKTLAKFHQAYISGAIKWNQFIELEMANERMFCEDYSWVLEIFKEDGIDHYEENVYQIDRLCSLGLLYKNSIPNENTYLITEDSQSSPIKDITVTAFGKLFCQNGLL